MSVVYVVHSDCNENNVLCEFTGRGSKQEAIAYAKRWGIQEQQIFIDRVVLDENYEVVDEETILNYCEDEWEEE